MEINEIEYNEFIQWVNNKQGECGFTVNQVEFAKQIFEFFVDYPSFRKKCTHIGDTKEVFFKIQQFIKEKEQ